MDIVCKPKYNVIFWRENEEDEWQCENLDTMIESYGVDSYTELEYWQPVRREDSEDILYHVFFCQRCKKPILAVDANHGYKFCPHCGRAIWSEQT